MTRITGTLREDQNTFLIISHSELLRMRNVSDKVVDIIKTYILYLIVFFSIIVPFMR